MLRRERGSILVLSMFVMTLLLLFGGVLLQLSVINIMHIIAQSERVKAFWIAKAGISTHLHNLREFYNLYEEYTDEREFAGGKFKMGSATLIGRGYHNLLIVVVGEYGNSKLCICAEVSMNTPTDYLHFSDLKTRQSYYRNVLGGPIHVNGDVVIGRSWQNSAFMKSDTEYGPVIEASGKVYNAADWSIGSPNPDYINYYLVIGEGSIPKPWVYNFNNYTKYYYITPLVLLLMAGRE